MAEISDPERLLTSAEVARLLQVDATSVINWSKKGYLAYYRTPGGHRRIRAADVVDFAQKRGMPVPLLLEPLSSLRVVVAEGDTRQVSTWKKAFEMQGKRVNAVYVQSCVAAAVELGTFRPHAVVLDQNLDGFAAAEQIKKKQEYADLRVVVVGDKFTSDVQKKAAALGIECMTRPHDPARLSEFFAQP